MRALEVLAMIVAGGAGAALAVVLVGASLVLVLPAVIAIGVASMVADHRRSAPR